SIFPKSSQALAVRLRLPLSHCDCGQIASWTVCLIATATMRATPATDFKFLGENIWQPVKLITATTRRSVHSGTFMSPANLVLERGDVPCLKPKKLLGGMFG